MVPLPDLRATWRTAIVGAEVEPDGHPPKSPSVEELLQIGEWLELARLISRYEPRFLRQVRFSERYDAFLAALVGGVAGWLEDVVAPEPEYDDDGEPLGLTSEDEETDAILSRLEDTLRDVAHLVPSLAPDSNAMADLCSALRDEFSAVEREREEWHERQAEKALENWEPDEDEGDHDDLAEPTIEEMLADL